MITQTTEYALRAVVFLASQDKATPTHTIAQITRIPQDCLVDVMQKLSRAEIVVSPGSSGNQFSLARPPEQLTALQVIDAMGAVRRIHQCPLGMHGVTLCPLHQKLDEAAKVIEDTFRDTTVADLIRNTEVCSSECSFPSQR